MYEATDLLLRHRPLLPDVPALLWQIGPLETCLHSLRVSLPERLPADRALAPVLSTAARSGGHYCSPHPLLPPAILRFALEDMGSHAHRIHAGFSFYIPPAASRPIHDYEMLGRLYSIDHLRGITRS